MFAEVLVDLYAEHGIRDDVRTHRLPAPTLPELLRHLRQLSAANRYVRDLLGRVDGRDESPLAYFVAGTDTALGDAPALQIQGISPWGRAFLTCAAIEGCTRRFAAALLTGDHQSLRRFVGAAESWIATPYSTPGGAARAR